MKKIFLIIFFSFFLSTVSYSFTEHIEKKEQFKKLGIKKIYLKCSIDTIREQGKHKNIWFSSLRNKMYFDFNVEQMLLERIGFGKHSTIKKNPFYFTHNKSEGKKYIEFLGVVPETNQIIKIKINYYDNNVSVIDTGIFEYSSYQLGEDSFNNFIKFHYKIGTINEFEIWEKNYPLAIDLYFKGKTKPDYQLTKIFPLDWMIGSCNN